MPRLIAIDGEAAGAALTLSGAGYLFEDAGGRLRFGPEGPVPAEGIAVSADASGLVITPLASARSEGVALLNGVPVLGPRRLKHGDLLVYAGTKLIFDSDEAGTQSSGSGSRPTGSSGSRGSTLDPGRSTARPCESELGSAPELDAAPTGQIRYRSKVLDDPGVEDLGALRGDSERLAKLLQVSAMLGATLDLAEVMTRLLDLIFDLVPARRGTILLLDRASKKLRATVSKVRGQDTRRGAHVAVSRTIVREALRTREAILTLDAQADERFLTGESIAAAGIRSALCAPIVRQRRILGAVHLDTMSADRSFSRGDVDLLAGIVGVAALAIENARLYQQAAERERLRYELQLAHDIQQRLLPKTAPKARGLSVFGLMQPAREVGGDLYDFVGEADGSLHMFVGDVSGKGVGAGLIMAMARSYFRPLTSLHTSPRDVMIEMNRLLFQDTQADKFMSAVYLHWDAESQSLRYCGAGQEHLLIYRARTGTCEAIPAGGVALAVIEDASPFLEDQTLPLEPGDAVVMYTDGATEARDASGEFFQLERLQPLVTEFGGDKSAHAIVAKIVDRLQTWVGRAEPHDDLTLVALKRLPQ